jgi:hypothetical protein
VYQARREELRRSLLARQLAAEQGQLARAYHWQSSNSESLAVVEKC